MIEFNKSRSGFYLRVAKLELWASVPNRISRRGTIETEGWVRFWGRAWKPYGFEFNWRIGIVRGAIGVTPWVG